MLVVAEQLAAPPPAATTGRAWTTRRRSGQLRAAISGCLLVAAAVLIYAAPGLVGVMFKTGEQTTIALPGVSVHKAYLTASSAENAPSIRVNYLPEPCSSVKRVSWNIPGTTSSMTPSEVAESSRTTT